MGCPMRLQRKIGAPEGRLYIACNFAVLDARRKKGFFSCHWCSLWPKVWDVIDLVVACIISTLLMLIQLFGSFENLVAAFDSWPSVAVKSIKLLFRWCSAVFPLLWILYCLCCISLSPPILARVKWKLWLAFALRVRLWSVTVRKAGWSHASVSLFPAAKYR